MPNDTKEVFRVDEVKATNPAYPSNYLLKDLQGEPITGRFHDQELSRTQYERDKELIIEKVLKERHRKGVTQYYVKFEGLPEEQAAWITSSDVVQK